MNLFNWVRDNIGILLLQHQIWCCGGITTYDRQLCDTANFLVALARDDGITSRYVHGTCQFTSGTWYGHVWAQFYVNGKWYTADATSYSNSLGVIKNWNTATYTLNTNIHNTTFLKKTIFFFLF